MKNTKMNKEVTKRVPERLSPGERNMAVLTTISLLLLIGVAVWAYLSYR